MSLLRDNSKLRLNLGEQMGKCNFSFGQLLTNLQPNLVQTSNILSYFFDKVKYLFSKKDNYNRLGCWFVFKWVAGLEILLFCEPV